MMTTETSVIDRVNNALVGNSELTQVQVAKQAGMSEAVLSALMAGTYKGNVERNLAKLGKWLKTREDRVKTKELVRGPKGEWLPLPTAVLIQNVLKMAQAVQAWGLVYKGAGIGKTTTARHYQSENSNVWIFTADPFRNNEMAVLQGLCDQLKITTKGMTRARMSQAISQRISGTDGLLIIDEAQYLSDRILNGIRVLTDDRIGVVLLGNDVVRTRMDTIGTAVDMNPVWSRVIKSLELPTVSRKDIISYLGVWGIEDKDIVRFACDMIPRSVGALRSLYRLLQVATSIATSTHQELSLGHIKEAWGHIGVVTNEVAAK
ncbi:hypothetical protein D3C85_905680 [compost metagenome]